MDHLKVLDCGNYYTIINTKGGYENHCHTYTENTAKMLCRLIKNKRVPKSKRLRKSAKRVTLDEKYQNEIDIKIEKDRQKPKYVNINKGVKK